MSTSKKGPSVHANEHTSDSGVWVPVPEYEGFYEISLCGNIRRIDGTLVTKKRNQRGDTVNLRSSDPLPQESSLWDVRELMMFTFGPNRPAGSWGIAHRDGDKFNVNIGNLEWVNSETLASLEAAESYIAKLQYLPSSRKSRAATRRGPIPEWRKLNREGRHEAALDAFKAASRVDPVSGCWVWPQLDDTGYPAGAMHRFSLECREGAPLGSQAAHHKCANRACVNPDHLQPVTAAENTAEMLARQSFIKRILELEEELRRVYPSSKLLDRVSYGSPADISKARAELLPGDEDSDEN